jgi:type I restriction enzyme R subunit
MEEADSLDPKIRDDTRAKRKMVADFLRSERHLRSKRELIEKFIEFPMPSLGIEQNVQAAFSDFWNAERLAAIEQVCAVEQIDPASFRAKIEQYHFSGKSLLQGKIVEAL